MATTIASKILINIALLLLIGVNLASSREYSGVLARLYKKASQQNRPLVLVLDNAHRGKSTNVHKAHKHSVANSESNKNLNPLVYLYQLGQAQKKKQLAQRSQRVREDRDDYRFKSRTQDRWDRLQFSDERDTRDEWDRREDRDRWEQRDRREKRDRREDRYRAEDSTREDNDDDVSSSRLLKQLLDITNNLLRQNDDTCDQSNECGVSQEQEIVIEPETPTTDDTPISTKGVLYEPESHGCKKCH